MGDVWRVPYMHCSLIGRTRLCGAHFGRIVLLDVHVFVPKMEIFLIVDSRLLVLPKLQTSIGAWVDPCPQIAIQLRTLQV